MAIPRVQQQWCPQTLWWWHQKLGPIQTLPTAGTSCGFCFPLIVVFCLHFKDSIFSFPKHFVWYLPLSNKLFFCLCHPKSLSASCNKEPCTTSNVFAILLVYVCVFTSFWGASCENFANDYLWVVKYFKLRIFEVLLVKNMHHLSNSVCLLCTYYTVGTEKNTHTWIRFSLCSWCFYYTKKFTNYQMT